MTVPVFSHEELNFISDKTFFEKKAAISNRVIEQLNELQKKLNLLLSENGKSVPESVLQSSPKISRGENYKGFPWMVLDYPRVFNSTEVFAFRTLFWWGHSWVLTFHLTGTFLENYRSQINSNLKLASNKKVKIGIGQDPWIHNPDDSMYIDIENFVSGKTAFRQLNSQPFFKLVRKIEFSQTKELLDEAIEFYRVCFRLLKT